jgi:hypothetical protein
MFATVLGLEWKGKDSFAHPFDLVEVPQSPGVIKLHIKQTDGDWSVFYVAQFDNLYHGLLFLMQGTGEKVNREVHERVHNYVCGYSYAVLPDKQERLGALKALLEHFKPECNDLEKDMPKDAPNLRINFY